MEPGIDYLKNSRGAFETMFGLEKYLAQSGLDHKLMTLIKLRGSQINDAPTALTCIGRICGPREKRTTALWLGCLARVSLLQRAGARRSRLGGSRHKHPARSCSQRSL